MSKKLLVLPGDGIGQEVTASAVEVLNYLVDANNLDIEISYNDVGGASYDKYGEPLTEEVLKEAKASDAILFGAVGGPKYDDLPWDKRPENALLGLRKELQLFANLRPSYLFNELASASPIKDSIIQGLDILIVRELTGGIYFGEPRSLESDKAFNTMVYNYDEIARILKVAFEAASKRNKKLCSVDKANVLEVSKFWRSITNDIAKEYPDVEVSHQLVDNAAMQLVLDPNQFDVIVSRALANLNNLFSYSHKFVKKNTVLIFLKGKTVNEEISGAETGWSFVLEKHPSTTNPEGTLLVITKLNKII